MFYYSPIAEFALHVYPKQVPAFVAIKLHFIGR